MTLVNNVKNSNIIYTNFIKITKEIEAKRDEMIFQSLPGSLSQEEKPGLLISIPVFY